MMKNYVARFAVASLLATTATGVGCSSTEPLVDEAPGVVVPDGKDLNLASRAKSSRTMHGGITNASSTMAS